MRVWNCAILPSSHREPEQQCREIFGNIFENDIQYTFVSMIMPIGHVIVGDEYRRRDEKHIPSVATHENHHYDNPNTGYSPRIVAC